MKFVLFATWAAVLALGTAGCGVLSPEPSYATDFYTLAAPPETFPESLQFRNFSNQSGVANRMHYLTGDGEMVIDEYRRWSQSPELMLTNYLRRAFSDREGAPVLDATVFLWETDVDAQCVSLGVEAQLNGSQALRFRRIYSAPFASMTPEAMAAAFSECAGQLAEDLRNLEP